MLNTDLNRKSQKWTRKELAGRFLWDSLGVFLFRLAPRQLWVWRRILLRFFGAKIGREVHIHPTVFIAVPWQLEIGDYAAIGDRARLYSLGKITIGAHATVSQHAHLCAGSHDISSIHMLLTKPRVAIGQGAWICTDAYVGPGVSVGDNAVVGARAVCAKDVSRHEIVAGNPARSVGNRRYHEE